MIAVVGATGVLGTQLLVALGDEEHPVEELTLFASERSHGKEVEVAGETLEIEPIDFRGVKLAFIATPLAAAKPLIEEARKAGTRVVDFSGAFRPDRAIPHIVPGVSAAPAAEAPAVGIAGAAGSALAHVLSAIHRWNPIAWADVTGLYGAAHRGSAGIDALEKETAALLSGRGVDTEELAPHQLAFNVVPHVGAFAKGHPQSSEELAAALDVARAFDKAPVVRMTALHVPVFHGLSLALSMQLTNAADAEAVRAALKANDKVKVVDAPDESIYPTTQLTAADDAVLVGRIRTAGNHVWLVAAVDNAAFVAHGAVRLALELLY